MKELNYNEAILLARAVSDELVKNEKLREHCKNHNLNYNNVVSFIRGTRKLKQPKLLIDFLASTGYSVGIDKQIIYKFIVDTDEATRLEIENLIANQEN